MNAAYDCIAGDGYAQVSLRQIAKKAGVAVSQISYHYRNKEGLLLAVVARTAKNYHAYLQDYLRPDMTPPREKEIRLSASTNDFWKRMCNCSESYMIWWALPYGPSLFGWK